MTTTGDARCRGAMQIWQSTMRPSRMIYQRNYPGASGRCTAPWYQITNSRTGHGMYVSVDKVYAF